MVLHLALSEPERVSALVLSDSAGLGRAVNPAQAVLSSPGGAELAATWAKTPAGATERAFQRGCSSSRVPGRFPKVARGPVPAGANAELHGSDVGFPTREHRSGGWSPGICGATHPPPDDDGYPLG